MLGKVLHNSGHRREALRHLKRAKWMAIASDTLSSSIYFWIAYVYYHEKRLPEALDSAKEAWKLSEPLSDMVNQAQISFVLGMILLSANRDAEASLTTNLGINFIVRLRWSTWVMGIFGEVTTSMRTVPTRRRRRVILVLLMKSQVAPSVRTTWPRSRMCRGTLT